MQTPFGPPKFIYINTFSRECTGMFLINLGMAASSFYPCV